MGQCSSIVEDFLIVIQSLIHGYLKPDDQALEPGMILNIWVYKMFLFLLVLFVCQYFLGRVYILYTFQSAPSPPQVTLQLSLKSVSVIYCMAVNQTHVSGFYISINTCFPTSYDQLLLIYLIPKQHYRRQMLLQDKCLQLAQGLNLWTNGPLLYQKLYWAYQFKTTCIIILYSGQVLFSF